MRTDLAKLTTEKERGGSSNSSKKYGGRVRVVHDSDHLYEDERGGFHSSSRHRQYNHKSLSDVLNPIKGVLRKNVGRNWDDVYSEFSRFLDRRSVNGIHIFGHMLDYVKTRGIYEEGGQIWEYQAGVMDTRYTYDYKTKQRTPNPEGKFWLACDTLVTGFYVHPRTGILCHRDRVDRTPYLGNPYWDRHWRYRQAVEVKVIDEIKLENGYYRKEEVGHSPKSMFEAWFHYKTEKIFVEQRRHIRESDVEGYRLGGVVVYESPKMKEQNYAFDGVEVPQTNFYIVETVAVERTHKRTCNRKDMKFIREYLAKRLTRMTTPGNI